MSRKLRLTIGIVVILVLLVILLLLGLYGASRHEPAFYREALEIEPAVLEKGSDQMLQRTTALVSAVKKKGSWKALFTTEQINGWLAVDRVKNHPKALPSELRDPRVIINAKQIIIACRYEHGGVNSVLSLTVEPSVPEPNVVALRIVKARAGLLPVPLSGVLGRISEAARGMDFQLRWLHAGGDPVAMISFPPSDGRFVGIETLRLSDGEIFVAGSTRGK